MNDAVTIEVSGLSHRYDGSGWSLRDVTFSLSAGETVAVVGPNGAGKSTLLHHLNGLLPTTKLTDEESAAVRVGGRAVVAEHLPWVRQQVGLLFQNPDDQLFCPSVGRDVAFGPLNLGLSDEEVSRRVASSLEAVGLQGYEDRDTMQLSEGEKKRACLAGVLACDPSVLVLDEPFANLDPRGRRQLAEILRQFRGTCLVATHDLDWIVDLCDRVLVLDEGRLQADGSTRTILADRTLVERHGLDVPVSLRSPTLSTEKNPAASPIVTYNSTYETTDAIGESPTPRSVTTPRAG